MRAELLLLALLLTGCPPTVEPDLPSGPAPEAGTPADCADACAHLRELGCPEGAPTPAGGTCEAVCENAEGSGAVTLDPVCVGTITTCAALEQCTYGGG